MAALLYGRSVHVAAPAAFNFQHAGGRRGGLFGKLLAAPFTAYFFFTAGHVSLSPFLYTARRPAVCRVGQAGGALLRSLGR